jgi:hypothetical protein
MAARADDFTIATAKQAVDWIVKHIENNFVGFNISEIIKAGSLGQGTAVPGSYDIDLVIYSRDFTGEDVLEYEDKFEPWTSQLKSFIERVRGVTMRSRSLEYSVQFAFNYRGMSIDVDLLVSPYWESPDEFYDFLKDIPHEDRPQFSVCAAKWQKEFFKRQTNQDIKEYIRRAKAWRNREWGRSKTGKPNSYLMSLLVVRAYENAQHQGSVDPHRYAQVVVYCVYNNNNYCAVYNTIS